jgi:NarL family two-component system response regulator LiaR
MKGGEQMMKKLGLLLLRGIANAVRSTYHGESVLEPEVTGKMMVRMRQKGTPLPHEQLTSRELEVLLLLAEGKTNQEIADELIIALKTVNTCQSYFK